MQSRRGRPTSLLLTLLAWAGPAIAELKVESVGGNEAIANEVLVKFRGKTRQDPAGAVSANNVERFEWIASSLVLMRSRDKDVVGLIQDLSARSNVEYAEPNYLLYPDTIPNDPFFDEQYALQNTGQRILGSPALAGADIGAVRAWATTTLSRA